MKRWLFSIFIFILLILPLSVTAEDSTYVDTARDSITDTLVDSLPDSMSVVTDTVADSTAALTFEEKLKKYRKQYVERTPSFSFFDTVAAGFASERLNYNKARNRSSFHDVGDYFRSNPAFFILDHQETPMRKTVQPFGLSGDRMNLVINREPVHPFEHVIEPDGLIDMNDIPSAFDRDVYILPGPVGRLFGGRQMVATLVTLPVKPVDHEPVTSISADKGDYFFSWVRGKYSRRFLRGRSLDLSIEYRKAEGPISQRVDDSYNYFGDMFFPLGERYGLRGKGYLYNRDGWQDIRSDNYGEAVSRYRFDRQLDVSLERTVGEGEGRWLLGYKHIRQGSFSDGNYKSRYNQTGNGGYIAREWTSGHMMFNVRLDGDYLAFESYQDLWARTWADFTLDIVRLGNGLNLGLSVGGRYDEEYEFLPNAAVVIKTETDRWLAMFSVGYTEREPSLYEQFLPEQRAMIYSSTALDYANRGNRDLRPERQLTGNLRVEYGNLDNAAGIDITGGQIRDGIDWHHEIMADSITEFTEFRPMNGDIDFVSVSFYQKLKYRELATLTSGGSWRKLEYAEFDDKAYLPEYQIFSGLELHHYLKKQRLHVFAYGEITYVGPYHGYVVQNLGRDLIVNVKLSVGLTNFRFHLVWQNMLNTAYSQRDYMTFRGSFFYYGLVWNFND